MGQFYDYGDGVKANADAALHWYRRAYRNGDYSAANNIGCIWRDRGKLGRALLWFGRAVMLGDADANLNIAKIYLRRKHDLQKAAFYLTKTDNSKEATEGSIEEDARPGVALRFIGNIVEGIAHPSARNIERGARASLMALCVVGEPCGAVDAVLSWLSAARPLRRVLGRRQLEILYCRIIGMNRISVE